MIDVCSFCRFLNQIFVAQLVHAPEFPWALSIGLGVAGLVVVVIVVVVLALHFTRRRVQMRKTAISDPLLAVRTPSGKRLLEGYQTRLLISCVLRFP